MLKQYDRDKDGLLAKEEFVQLRAGYLRDKRLRALGQERWTVTCDCGLSMRWQPAWNAEVVTNLAKGDELIAISAALEGAWLQCRLQKQPSIQGWVLTASTQGRRKKVFAVPNEI